MTASLALGTLGWSARTTDADLRAMIEAATSLGFVAVDTANAYDNGATETRIASLGTPLPVWTKAGLARANGQVEGLAPVALRSAAEGSLRRLGAERIDRFTLHAPDPNTPLEQTLHALRMLVTEGKIRAWGMSNYPAWRIAEALSIARDLGLSPPEDVQILYHSLAREAELEMFPMAQTRGLSISVYNPLAGGRLARTSPESAGRLATNAFYKKRYGAPALLERARGLETVAHHHGLSLPECALRFVLSQPQVSTVVVGPRTPAQLVELAGWHAKGALTSEALAGVLAQLDGPRGMTETYIRGH